MKVSHYSLWGKNMIKRVRRMVRSCVRYKEFKRICRTCNLNLDWKSNSNDVNTLKEIFVERCYADYFPFYQNAVIVDIGAHKGYFTIFASKNTSEASRFICLEPAKENLSTLTNNLKDNQVQNVTILSYGIYSHRCNINLYASKSVNYSVYDTVNTSNDVACEITVISLRELLEEQQIDQVDFLKMDCEGTEYPALLQANEITLGKIRTISIEFHDLKNPDYSGLKLAECLEKNNFDIVKFVHKPSVYNLNYGMLIARGK